MIITRGISIQKVIAWSWKYVVMLLIAATLIAVLYYFKIIKLGIPWLPMSVIGTAVAFYTGFKNNSAYDRMWEARKIWGGIVNDSRSWGMMVDSFVTNVFTPESASAEEIHKIKQRLIYRHIAWLYAHRSQLLVVTSWEHASQDGYTGRKARYFQERFGVGLVDDEVTQMELQLLLPEDEYEKLIHYKNTATQIINKQGRDLRELHQRGLIDNFRHMELAKLLTSFYTLQGKNERIKKFPLPRQYANMSRYFVGIFVTLLPFSMIPELMHLTLPDNYWGLWMSVPITALVSWVYVMMEMTGDYSENPFQGMANDIPMLSLCRTIELDMREMLGETDLPPAIEPKNGILM